MTAGVARSERSLAQVMLRRHPSEVARLLEASPESEAVEVLSEQPAEVAVAILRHLTPDRSARYLAAMETDVARRILRAWDPNRSSAVLARLDEDVRERLLQSLPAGLATELREIGAHPADSAGAMMDARVTSFRGHATVREAVRRLRTFRNKRIHDVYLVDEEGKLAGRVALQDVVLAEPGTRLDSLVREPPRHVLATAPRSEVVASLEQPGATGLAVVDFEGRLLGVIRADRVLGAVAESATANLAKMVGAGGDERALSPPLFAVRKRLPWLQINLLTAFLAAAVVGLFESTIAQFTALAVLLPVVAGQSGNTGAQALAVTMRGLALREVRVRNWMRVAGKEIAVAAINGVAVAVTTSVAVGFWSQSIGLAAVIGVAMVISMTIAGLAGAAIPMLLTALRQDPAQSSSIILTTVTDVVGFFSFLGIATAFSRFL